MISLHEVSKSYSMGQGDTRLALDQVSCSVDPGDFVTVLGPSGSGKSTFLSIAGLLDLPSQGSVEIDGEDVSGWSDAKRTQFRAGRCGFVFQFPSLVPTLSTLENVLLPKTVARTFKASDVERAEVLLAEVGLLDKKGQRPFQLSGGEQRRVALARALIHDPKIILADEPTGALDHENALRIMNLLQAHSEQGTTIVMVTHDRDLIRYGNRVLHLSNGQIERDEEVVRHV